MHTKMSIKHSVVKFKFEDFAGLTQEKGDCIESQTIEDCHGNNWRLSLYPRGGTDSLEDKIRISLFNGGTNEVSARATFIVRDANGKVYADRILSKVVIFECNTFGWGIDNTIKRSDILDKEKNILVNGALHVDVHIEIQPDSVVLPPNPLANNMLRLLDDVESADVQFEVDQTVISAHKCILKTNACHYVE